MGKRKAGQTFRSPVYLTSFDRVAGASDGLKQVLLLIEPNRVTIVFLFNT